MDVHDPNRFRVGTLVYTRAGLVTLFAWLLWGDFVYTLMEAVMPNLLPLLLRDNGASNKAIAFIVSSIFMIINAFTNPIISYKSDRFRSRWGRRRPFILVTTPFVVLFLSLIPFAPEISRYLLGIEGVSAWLKLLPITAVVLVSGVFVVLFQLFNMFVSTVYYYLQADVIPEAFIGRFYGLFRIFGILASLVFNYFIFGMAKEHMTEIFIGIAVFYGISITLMCIMVKEGDYPPPIEEEHSHFWSGIRNYAVECFGHRIYLLIFAAYALSICAGASNVFAVFFRRDQLGLSLGQIGKLTAYVSMACLFLTYPMGILIDRFGCHKSLITSWAAAPLLLVASFFCVHDYWTLLLFTFLISVPTIMASLAVCKWQIDLYPRDRYGQFGSAGGMTASIVGAATGPLCGLFFDWAKDYRYVYMWPAVFYFCAACGAWLVYREWNKLGGETGYKAP